MKRTKGKPKPHRHKLNLPNIKKKIVKHRKKAQPKEKSLYELFDEKDVQQIVNIQKGVIVKEPFYMVEMKTVGEDVQTVFGISYAGTIEIAKVQKQITVLDFQRSDTEDTFVSLVRVRDERTGLILIGCGVQPKFSGQFAQIISVSKAQRNGIRPLLYQNFIEKCFKAWYKNIFHKIPDMKNVKFVSESDLPSSTAGQPSLFEGERKETFERNVNAKKS